MKTVEELKQIQKDMMLREMVLLDINKERARQNNKWGRQRHSYGQWLKIFIEEVGEVAQAMQKDDISYKEGSDSDDLYEELIQAAAVAGAIAEQVLEERSKLYK